MVVNTTVPTQETAALITVVNVDDVITGWLTRNRSVNTRQAYMGDLRDFCRTIYHTDDIVQALQCFFRLSEVEASMVLTRFKQALQGRGIKATTINRKLSALRTLVKHARQWGVVTWRGTDLVQNEKVRTNPVERVRSRLPAASVEGLLKALQRLFGALPRKGIRALRDRTMIALMALHGLRRVEVCRLSLADILTDADGIALRVWGKGDKFRIVRLRSDTSQLLQAYLQALKRAGIAPKPDAIGVPVFVGLRKGKGKRLTVRQVNRLVDAVMAKAGIKRSGLSCHSLRHTFATLVAQEVPLHELATYLGHTSIAGTGVYVHALGNANPAVVIKVKALDEGRGEYV